LLEECIMLRLQCSLSVCLTGLVLFCSPAWSNAQQTAPPAAGRTATSEPAKLKVFVPAGAVLHVDGALTQATGEIRNFVSPPLPAGKKFLYTLRATWKEGGKEFDRERTVRVAAGQETTVDFRSPFEPSATTGDKDAGIFSVSLPDDVVAKMLELADAKKTDVICDPKCGDGQVLVSAAQKSGARGVGFESDGQRANEAAETAKKSPVAGQVAIQKAALADVDFKDATIVLLHCSTGGAAKLQAQLARLKPGVRIVSDGSELKGARPARKISYVSAGARAGEGKEHTLYLWVVPWEGQ
jgi:uncharacterized protein (TIGR03000 family)